MTWPDVADAVKAGATTVVLPLGATEQHGPHMGMNVDVVLPTAVCERVARNVGGIVAPAVPYGYKSQPRSGGGEAFPGTTSLDANTFSLVVRDVIRSLGHDGVRRLVVVGLAGDYCVKETVLDGLRLGYDVHVPLSLTRFVNLAPGDDARATEEMSGAGTSILD